MPPRVDQLWLVSTGTLRVQSAEMGNANTLVVIGGKLSSASLPVLQLKLRDYFQFQMENQVSLTGAVLSTGGKPEVLRAPELGVDCAVGELSEFLRRERPSWQECDRVVYYPAACYFKEPARLEQTLRSLLDSRTPSMLFRSGEQFLCALSARELAESPGDRRVADLPYLAESALDAEVANLSTPLGIFDATVTQTPARMFNSFRPEPPYLWKTSSEVEKAEREYAFLRNLPPALKPFFPEVGASREEGATFSYQIKFVPMLDLGRFWLHRSLSPQEFGALLVTLGDYLAQCPRQAVPVEVHRQSLRALFVSKLLARMARLRELHVYPRLLAASQSVYDGGIEKLSADLVAELKTRIDRTTGEALYLSHGDLCFSNILWDRLSSTMQLIDPRGLCDEHHGYLPRAYDLAKLSHSVLGGYDWIMGDRMDADAAEFEAYRAPFTPMFTRWLGEMGADLRLVRLGEASLFLSMLPLHADRPGRLLAHVRAGARAWDAR